MRVWLTGTLKSSDSRMNTRPPSVVPACVLALCVACADSADHQPAPPARPPGTIALGERIVVPSRILGASRTVLVHLPDGYRDEEGVYPLVIVLDGESNFLTAASAARFLA